MKFNYSIYILFTFAFLVISGCGKDILDTQPRDAFAEDFIYGDADQLERLVFTAYNSTESWGINRVQWWGRRFNIE